MWLLAGAALLVAAGLAVPGAASSPAAPVLAPPPVPGQGSAYVGAYVAPTGVAGLDQVQGTAAFEQQIGRPLGIDDYFQSWDDFAIGPGQLADARAGSIPMISWACDTRGVGEILDGQEDKHIDAAAAAVRNYGHPVFIRYWWEMNLTFLNRNVQCSDGLGALGFIRSWRYVRERFLADGATNASFVWVVGGSGVGAVADQFYPGDAYVDWVGIDNYSRTTTIPFATLMQPFYRDWSGRKPIMVAETGVVGLPEVQSSWLDGLSTALSGSTFPDIKAVVYEDDISNYDYRLTGSAITSFGAIAAKPYFQAMSPHLPLSIDAVGSIQLKPRQSIDQTVRTAGFPVATLRAVSLPLGLYFIDHGDGTGSIRGTPKVGGALPVAIVATSPDGSVSTEFTLTVLQAPVILGADTLTASTAAPVTYAITTVASPAASLTVTGLPAGFQFLPQAAGQGIVVGAGNPGTGGVYNVKISATNSSGTSTRMLKLTILDQPRVLTTDAVAAYVGRPLRLPVEAGGFPLPAVSITGPVPAWLQVTSLRDGRALLSGTPTDPGVFTLVVHVVAGSQQINYEILVTVHR